MKEFLWISLCFTLLASCAGEAYYASNTENSELVTSAYNQEKTQSTQIDVTFDYMREPYRLALQSVQLARLGEPSLVWREGKTTILQFAGMPEDKRVPDCTLLVFLDARGQPTGLHSRNPAGFDKNRVDDYADNAACFKAWSKFKRRKYRG